MLQRLLTFFVLLVSTRAVAQTETAYWDYRQKPVASDSAYMTAEFTPAAAGAWDVVLRYRQGADVHKGQSASRDTIVHVGTWTTYDSLGRIKETERYVRGSDSVFRTEFYPESGQVRMTVLQLKYRRMGELLSYYPNGRLKRREYFDGTERDVRSKRGTCYDSTGAEIPFTPYENMPEYEGDASSFLSRQVRYPAKARSQHISGRVVVGFVVNQQGGLEDLRIVRSVHPLLDAEALRATKLMDGKWAPGRRDGEMVPVHFMLPITFRLED